MKKFFVFLMVFVLASAPAFAASPWNQPSVPYGQKAWNKFVYGFKNVIFGWTEILQEPMEAHKEGKCMLMGLGEGIGNALGDTVGGAIHLVTFWCPKTDIPLPEGGTDIEKTNSVK